MPRFRFEHLREECLDDVEGSEGIDSDGSVENRASAMALFVPDLCKAVACQDATHCWISVAERSTSALPTTIPALLMITVGLPT